MPINKSTDPALEVGGAVTYLAEMGQMFANGATTAPATITSIDDLGRAHVLVTPDGGEPFTAIQPNK